MRLTIRIGGRLDESYNTEILKKRTKEFIFSLPMWSRSAGAKIIEDARQIRALLGDQRWQLAETEEDKRNIVEGALHNV